MFTLSVCLDHSVTFSPSIFSIFEDDIQSFISPSLIMEESSPEPKDMVQKEIVKGNFAQGVILYVCTDSQKNSLSTEARYAGSYFIVTLTEFFYFSVN